jgi:serine O-acetyltransferase
MIRSKADYYYYLNQDKLALGINTQGFGHLRYFFFPHPIWKWERLLRKLEYLKNVEMKSSNLFLRYLGYLYFVVSKIKFRRMSIRLGFSISPNTFGPGLSIAHYGTIIVNENVRVGANCRLHGCVNIGASNGCSKAPVIGDNCYIGPSVVIFGDISISDNVTIGANSTVNKSFNIPNSVIVGSPAYVVKENVPNWLQMKEKDV